jgi:hypothetical protein
LFNQKYFSLSSTNVQILSQLGGAKQLKYLNNYEIKDNIIYH